MQSDNNRKRFSLLTLNIGNPSLERAQRQCEWLSKRKEDIFVLTETKHSKGCTYIKDYFQQYQDEVWNDSQRADYYVYSPMSHTGDLGVMIISKYPIMHDYSLFDENSIYYSRTARATVVIPESEIDVLGVYVPSRDRSESKIIRKKRFVKSLETHLFHDNCKLLLVGDLNMVSKEHIPHYSTFYEWEYEFFEAAEDGGLVDAYLLLHSDVQEYSWVGRTNNGYRYDYCLVSKDISDRIVECEYIHETRVKRLTDHSGVSLVLSL